MQQKRIMLINDVTGYSRCAIAAQLPLICAMGIECSFVPTAILSVNTYHSNYFFDDYTNRMEEYMETYKKMDVEYNGIVTGFLGSKEQVEIVSRFIEYFKQKDTFVLIDPVMGDHGKLYKTYTKELQAKMRQLVGYATIMTPNLTELYALLDLPYCQEISETKLVSLCAKLASQGPQMIVVTGISWGDEVINFAYQKNGAYRIIRVKRIGEDRSGTGDVISAVIAGEFLRSHDFFQSVYKAVDFTTKCIEHSQKVGANPHLGLCFEPLLKELWGD